jgi:hypothetical protein
MQIVMQLLSIIHNYSLHDDHNVEIDYVLLVKKNVIFTI